MSNDRPKVVYVSGPIAGKPDGNKALFQEARWRLKREGWDAVLLPQDIDPWQHKDRPCPGGYRSEGADHAAACHLRNDLLVMLGQADAIAMLPGWELSVGARLELQVAATCGLVVQFLHNFGCEHVKHTRSRCDHEGCWNYRNYRMQKPVPAEAAVRRPDQPINIHLPDVLNSPTSLGVCAHRHVGGTTHCGEMVCPNYYGRATGS